MELEIITDMTSNIPEKLIQTHRLTWILLFLIFLVCLTNWLNFYNIFNHHSG
jgi:hypothetical protein